MRLIGFLAALVFCLVCVRWLMRSRAPQAAPVAPTPQIEVPAPAADPSAALPHATESEPDIASVEEMAEPGRPRTSSTRIASAEKPSRLYWFACQPVPPSTRELLGIFAQF